MSFEPTPEELERAGEYIREQVKFYWIKLDGRMIYHCDDFRLLNTLVYMKLARKVMSGGRKATYFYLPSADEYIEQYKILSEL